MDVRISAPSISEPRLREDQPVEQPRVLPRRPRKLRGGGDDDDDGDGGNGPKRPKPKKLTADELRRALERVDSALWCRPESLSFFEYLCEAATASGWSSERHDDEAEWQARMERLFGLMTGRYRDSDILTVLEIWPSLTWPDKSAISTLADICLTRLNQKAEQRSLFHFERLIDRIMARLSASEQAQLLATFNQRLVTSTGRRASAGTVDAASARLQMIADQFVKLEPGHQERIGELVVALADRPHGRKHAVRQAVRKFMAAVFSREDIAYFAKACVDWIIWPPRPAGRPAAATSRIDVKREVA